MRELQHAVQRAVILSTGEEIRPEDLPADVRAGEADAGAGARQPRGGTPARLADLTPLLRGEYDEAPDCLVPVEPHLPYLAVLSADDLIGTWSLWTLARLIDLPIYFAISASMLYR